jgi:argininosuccinate lyase
MKTPSTSRKTTVGEVDSAILEFTAGDDVRWDQRLVEADCIGSAAHAVMLSRMPLRPPLFQPADARRIVRQLVILLRKARQGRFIITLEDQDVHLAVERALTRALGPLGKKIHTARSRNDQVAVDLRLYAKDQLLGVSLEAAALAEALLRLAVRHERTPMVGRTHMQPAMPSSVGLWASAHAESLLDDMLAVDHAYRLNDQCPLGSAAGYGVPLPIDRALVSDLLGFERPCHNVLYAGNARGKVESVVLGALVQLMLTLSRLAQDLILFTMPEFNYFALPPAFCTGSSIMPQKKNPDVLELVRARASRVAAHYFAVVDLLKGAPSGYNRDLQEAKAPFLEGLATTRSCLAVTKRVVDGLQVNPGALRDGFTADVFAADRALELAGQGVPFRDAYHRVKADLAALERLNPDQALRAKKHLGGPGGLRLAMLKGRARRVLQETRRKRRKYYAALSRLLGVSYPDL